jgi:hypothetical protein
MAIISIADCVMIYAVLFQLRRLLYSLEGGKVQPMKILRFFLNIFVFYCVLLIDNHCILRAAPATRRYIAATAYYRAVSLRAIKK